MKRWVSCPAEVTYLFIIPGQYEKCVAVLWFLFELHKFFAAHACLQPIAFVRSFMLWVLWIRFAVLLFGDHLFWGCRLYSACCAYTLLFCFLATACLRVFFYTLRAGHTQYGFADVLGRQPGERGAARLQSPFPFRVFSPSPPLSSFPIPLWHTPIGYTFSRCCTKRKGVKSDG